MPLNREFLVERQGRQFALYAGLLDLAHQEGLRSIATELLHLPSGANGQTAICRATVVTDKGVFTGLGDACPANVSRQMLPHLIRLAETRGKARALRDAVNVGVAAVEELGPDGPADEAADAPQRPVARPPAPAPVPAAPSPLPAGPLPVPDPDRGATEPQFRLLRELAGRLGGREVPEGLTRGQASALIDQWKQEAPRPRAVAGAPRAADQEGGR
jgi:hypothetical protein